MSWQSEPSRYLHDHGWNYCKLASEDDQNDYGRILAGQNKKLEKIVSVYSYEYLIQEARPI